MINSLTHTDAKVEKKPTPLERRLTFLMYGVLVSFVLILAFPFAYGRYLSSTGTIITELEVRNMKVIGSSNLCPGDPLLVQFDFIGKGSGLIIEDATWYKMTPPMTIIPSESVRFILPEDFSRPVRRFWRIPLTYLDEATGKATPLEAGRYRRIYTLSSPTRREAGDIDVIDFTIRDDCP